MSPSTDREKSPKLTTSVTSDVHNVNIDDDILITMGYKPELKREFSYLSAFGQSWGSQGLVRQSLAR